MKIQKKQKNKFSLVQEYKKSFNYLRESKNFIFSIVALFFIFALIGFFVPLPEVLSKELILMLKKLLGGLEGLSSFGMIKFIFLNNLQSSFAGLFLGLFFGIVPIIVTLVNGFILGFVARIAVNADGIFALWKVFPHGIFELPAVFISLGLGVKFGTFIFNKKIFESFKDYLWNSLRVFILIVVPLLIISAIIEGSLISFFS
ncbi:stage II sporulation protein M [Candidatus Pacearchaeota archaeon]|nr:stage II sporulation protein M [Candidatus Pacearchaeota archaeon]